MAKFGLTEMSQCSWFANSLLDSPDAFWNSPHPLNKLYWSKGMFELKDIQTMLVRMRYDPRKVYLIVDSTGELEEEFRKIYPTGSQKGAILETNMPYDMSKFVELRLGISGIKIDPDVQESLRYAPLEQVLKIVKQFEHLHKFNMTGEDAKTYNLLEGTLATTLVDVLFSAGKMAVLKHSDFLSVSAREFRGLIQYRLLTLLRLKHVSGKVQECAIKMGLPVPVYKRYKKESDRFEYAWLVEHLLLVLRLKPWCDERYSSVLLLNYW